VGVESWIDWDRAGANVLAWLFTYALHSTVLIAGAWIVAVLLARAACRVRALRDLLPAIRDRLWKVALVGGLVTATLQSAFHVGPWQIRFGSELRGNPVSTAVPAAVPLTPALTRSIESAAPSAASALDAVPPSPAVVTPAAADGAVSWIGIVLALWAAGVAFGLARWICQWNRLLRGLDDRTPIDAGVVHEEFARLRAASGSKARVTLSSAPGIAAPLTLGLFRAEICVPPRVATDLRREEIAALLAHELAHVERHDPAWLVLCRAIEVVFFFQPLNRACAVWLADEAEYLSDDWAVVHAGERIGMASCLTEIAGWIVPGAEPRLVSGMAARGTRLSLRVGRLLDEDHEPATTARGTWLTSALAPVGLSAALIVPGVTTEDDERFASDRLASRTARLELAFTAIDGDTGSLVVPAEPLVEPDGDDEFVDVLALLDDEIEALRDELDTRDGGESIRASLDNLEQQVARLRVRARLLRTGFTVRTPPEWNGRIGALPNSNVFALDPVSKD
jgi:beta-lactamase regulating signal transducer with metallopeptidase domain